MPWSDAELAARVAGLLGSLDMLDSYSVELRADLVEVSELLAEFGAGDWERVVTTEVLCSNSISLLKGAREEIDVLLMELGAR